ncbi:MAG: UDP-4-amino-4,6-dideoxy-N-acetyl-beta-L-altrosamine transaminase [Boseongicola sp.]|nr:MAG: UDP-4-amino-4,6-dideoxy-N-acetyl-beta-L-altrosamine transaminase [Boseongicola sp.]
MIPYGRQDISEEDVAEVVAALTSDFLTQGPRVPAFEAAFCETVNAKYGVAVNSATSALHVACMALELGEGDILWTSPITFVASANVGHWCGADVDFVDIDPDTFNMCPKALARKLEWAEQNNCLPKIIIPVHMCGQSCDMQEIGTLARRYGIAVIEDASHAVGGRFHNQTVGSCAHSDIAVFSFHPVKVITTAEGGLATTQSAELADKMRRAASHGVTRDASLMQGESHGAWYYQQLELGLNYRMTELQAALGIGQLKRLDAFVNRRNEHAERYDELLADLPLKRPGRLPGAYSAFHLYVVRVGAEKRRAVFDDLRANGVGVNVHYIPVHTQPYWRDRSSVHGPFPAAEQYYSEAISLPLYPAMTEAQQDEVVTKLGNALA